MNTHIRIPAIVEFPSEDEYYVDNFILNLKELTGIKLKKKNLDRGRGSSYTPWLLYVKKDYAYIRVLEKFVAEEAE